MALWVVRAGQHGEHETRFLNDNRVYLTWDHLRYDLSTYPNRQKVQELLRTVYPDASEGRIINNSGQVWRFAHRIEVGDWVVLPRKAKSAICVGDVTGSYTFDGNAQDPYYHWHSVKWLNTDIPRSNFDQDLLYSFGAFMTICKITRNDAERRVRSMAEKNWGPMGAPSIKKVQGTEEEAEETAEVNLEELALDQITKLIERQFKGHDMTRLVEAILKAQGYTTFRSPEGPDKGIDILAAPGPLGFGNPRICVQVKSGSGPVDHPTLNQLRGAMENVGADQGLFVSWGGFKSSIDRDTAQHFFRVRFWDQRALIEELLRNYESIDEDLRAEIPIKKVWALATPEES